MPYEVVARPSPTVTWLRNGQRLSEGDEIYDNAIKNESGHRAGCLTFTADNHMYNGNYTLRAENEFGARQTTVYAEFMKSPGKGGSGI